MSDDDQPTTSLHFDLAMTTAAAVADAVFELFGPDRPRGREQLEAFLDGRGLLRVSVDECVFLAKPGEW